MQGRVKEAIAEYLEVLKITPKDPDAHTNLGLLLAGLGDTAQAKGHFSEALRLKPDHPQAKAAMAAAGKHEKRP
jgi:Flp pilus assembly protein TadD